jgi:peptidoglycan-associated lipoprotein
MPKPNLHTSILFLFISTLSFAQQNSLQKADSCFREKDNLHATELYKKILKKNEYTSEHPRIFYNIGYCYQQENNYNEALNWFDKAIKSNYNDPKVYLHYGEMKMDLALYSEAISSFEMYNELSSDELKSNKLINSCKFAIKTLKEQPLHSCVNEKNINSSFSEYGLALINDKLIFASTRIDENENRLDTYTGQGFSDFYESNLKNNQWSTPSKIKGEINTKYNEGSVFIEKNMNAYYMQCNGENGKKDLCNILKVQFDTKRNTWTKPEILNINSKGFSVGHPTLSKDSKTLYFVSDMPGGKGGKDIWKTTLIDNYWADPINISELNTDENEMFPFLSGDTVLFFSSDGIIGMGGLDLFKSRILTGDKFETPQNLKTPFNSSADDFSIVFSDTDKGMFCSNREGGIGDDDIYSFKIIPVIISVSGNITDKSNNKAIHNVTITIKGSDGSSITTETDSKGNYKVETLKSNVNYTISLSKEGYFGNARNLNIENEKFSKEFSKANGSDFDFSLIKMTKKEIEIPNIYYDFDSAILKEDSKKELDKLAIILEETPSVSIIINSHTDEQGNEDYNLKLSEKRAQAVVDYLISRGISFNRLAAKGFGESMPLVRNASDEKGHQKNRRTTFKASNL